MSTEKKNIYQKIQAVSLAVRSLSKDMLVGDGKNSYQAVSDFSVTLAVKTAESENGIISIPIKQELQKSESITTINSYNKEVLKHNVIIKMTTRILDLEDPSSFIDIESFGQGWDSGDKGFGKASTYARKTALLNAYKIATGEDPDQEPSKDDLLPPTISDKRKAVYDVMIANNNALNTVLTRYSIGQMEDLTEKNIEIQYNAWLKNGIIKQSL